MHFGSFNSMLLLKDLVLLERLKKKKIERTSGLLASIQVFLN